MYISSNGGPAERPFPGKETIIQISVLNLFFFGPVEKWLRSPRRLRSLVSLGGPQKQLGCHRNDMAITMIPNRGYPSCLMMVF